MKNDRYLIRLSVVTDSIEFSVTDILKDKENKEDYIGELLLDVYKENKYFCNFLLRKLNKISKEEINLRKNTVQEIYKCMEETPKKGATVFNYPVEALTLPRGVLGDILSIEYALNFIEQKLMKTIKKYKLEDNLKTLKESITKLLTFVDKEILITSEVKKVRINKKSKHDWYIKNNVLFISNKFYQENLDRFERIDVQGI